MIQTNLLNHNPELLSHFTELFRFWMEELVLFTHLFTNKNYVAFADSLLSSPSPHPTVRFRH